MKPLEFAIGHKLSQVFEKQITLPFSQSFELLFCHFLARFPKVRIQFSLQFQIFHSMKNITCLAFLLMLNWVLNLANAQVAQQEIQADWVVFGNDVNVKYPASVPGNIYTDLMNAEIIPDPFYRNE